MDPVREKVTDNTPPHKKKQSRKQETRLERAGNQSFSDLRKSIKKQNLTLSGSLTSTPENDAKFRQISACLKEEKRRPPSRSRNRSMPQPPSPDTPPFLKPAAYRPTDPDSFTFFSIKTQKAFRTKYSSLPIQGTISLQRTPSSFSPLFESQSPLAQRLSDLSRLLTLGSDNQVIGDGSDVILQNILQTATAILLDNKAAGLSANDATLIVLFLKNLEANEWARNTLLSNNKLWPLRLGVEKELNEGLPVDFIKNNLYDGTQSLQDMTFQITFFEINIKTQKLFISQLSRDLHTLFSTLFSNILLREFYKQNGAEKAVNIYKMTSFTTRLIKYLKAQLKNTTLTPNGRTNLYNFYIDLLHHSLTLGNYHGALAIYSAIVCREIAELQISTKNTKKQILLLAETTLSDRNNFENLRKAHQQTPSKNTDFITPSLEVYLQQFSVINSLEPAYHDTRETEKQRLEEQVIKIQARMERGTLTTNLLYTLLYSHSTNLPDDFDPTRLSIKTSFVQKKERPQLRKKKRFNHANAIQPSNKK